MATPYLSTALLQHYFDLFRRFIEQEDKEPLQSFSYGFLEDTEGYKSQAHVEGRKLLEANVWKERDIGTGSILKRVIAAIEKPTHNLVLRDARYGETRKGHYPLLQARNDRDLRSKWEKVLHGLFTHDDPAGDAEAFQRMIELGGKRYDMITFLFFLKNKRRYVPNSSPATFDDVFHALGAPKFSTSRHCSWENYRTFLALASQVLDFLREEMDDQVDLLDAHSFLWVVARHVLKPSNALRSVIPVPEELHLLPVFPRSEKKGESAPTFFDEEADRKQRIENTRTGRIAEQMVLDAEKALLTKAGRKDLADRVEQVSQNMSKGYDILSFDQMGREKHIEVKGTRSHTSCTFNLTANELRRSQELPDFYLYIVTGVDSNRARIRYIPKPNFHSKLFTLESLRHRVWYRVRST
ncbi:MAG: DUF3883 domain-containing protein [Candidatus Peribacteraceae bacterium]|nr:DUF3883 domain-containing protein [Candidatus Peribacteraceae bacterium]